MGIALHSYVAKHLQTHLCHKTAGKHVAYVRVARKKMEVQNHVRIKKVTAGSWFMLDTVAEEITQPG